MRKKSKYVEPVLLLHCIEKRKCLRCRKPLTRSQINRGLFLHPVCTRINKKKY